MGRRWHIIGLVVAAAFAFVFVSVTTDRGARADTVPAPVPGGLADRGNFRLRCEFSHLAQDDPLVHPGAAGASHLHMFFGNAETNAFSTPESIRTVGDSTCQGATSNRSAYWIPTVHDQDGAVRVPNFALFYYKTAGLDPSTIQEMPTGLRIIAGSAMGDNTTDTAYWTCAGVGRSTTIPVCAGNEVLTLTIHFPSCWDGTNLDSPDHRSHMAYSTWASPARQCPADHPVPLPEISFSFQFTNDGETTAGWHLSSDHHHGAPGGSTLHGDWINGWDENIMSTFVTNCLRAKLDCTNGELGDGTMLSLTPSNGAGSSAILDVADHLVVSTPELVINEIHYAPGPGGVEFIEVLNREAVAVDVSGHDLGDGMVTFEPGTMIEPGGYLVATADLAAFSERYPGVPAIAWTSGELSDEGQTLRLRAGDGSVIDEVTYRPG